MDWSFEGKRGKDWCVVDAAAASFGHYCRKACWEDLRLEVGGGGLHAALFFPRLSDNNIGHCQLHRSGFRDR